MKTEKEINDKILEKIRKGKPLSKVEYEIRFNKQFRKGFNRLLKGGLENDD